MSCLCICMFTVNISLVSVCENFVKKMFRPACWITYCASFRCMKLASSHWSGYHRSLFFLCIGSVWCDKTTSLFTLSGKWSLSEFSTISLCSRLRSKSAIQDLLLTTGQLSYGFQTRNAFSVAYPGGLGGRNPPLLQTKLLF